jgi:hypothetical protein
MNEVPSRLSPPSKRARALAALGIATLFGILALAYAHRVAYQAGGDFGIVWRGVQVLLDGRDPYRVLDPSAEYGRGGPIVFPGPTIVAAIPFGFLDPFASSALFFGMSAGLLAYGLSAFGWWRLAALLSPAMLYSLVAVNFPPLLAASALLPSFGWLAALKPSTGIVTFAYRPSWRTIAIGSGLVALSFVIMPNWVSGWLYQMQADTVAHRPPIAFPLGFLGLVGLTRWRTPEGRLLAMFAITPFTYFPYDYLLLWLVPKTRRELLVLTIPAWLVSPAALGASTNAGPVELVVVETLLQLGMLVPAAFIVWRHANVGTLPPWVERRTHWLPSRLRGVPDPNTS